MQHLQFAEAWSSPAARKDNRACGEDGVSGSVFLNPPDLFDKNRDFFNTENECYWPICVTFAF